MYKLTNTEEPTDEELKGLMKEVIKKVIHKAKIADKNFKNTMKADFIAVQKKYKTGLLNE